MMSLAVKVIQLFLLLVMFAPIQRARSAPLLSASELIAEVNALRASQGLQAYSVASGLTAYAQEHAEYCASLGHGTHQHSDGSYPWDAGIQENVASGTEGLLTVNVVVHTIWSDWGHWETMVGYTSGQVGAGMAISNGTVYYVLNVRGGEQAQITPQPSSSPSAAATDEGTAPAETATPASGSATAAYTFVPILTNTPQPDGSIVHIVKAGETLWSIALSYEVTVEELRWLNGMESDSNEIYVEQRLLIRPANTETPTPVGGVSDTPQPIIDRATRTPRPTSTPPPTGTATTAGSTPTSTPVPPFISTLDLKSLGIGVLVGLLILLAVGLNEFRRIRNH